MPNDTLFPSMNILVLAVSKVSPPQQETEYPLCLTEIRGLSVLEHLVNQTHGLNNPKVMFVFSQSDMERYHLEKITHLLVPDACCLGIPEQTRGSACTALLAACQLDQNAELLIVSANELIDMDLSLVVHSFRTRKLDGGTLVFRSVHPRYSYVALDDDGFVVETAQREPISSHATAGMFWFARTGDFVDAAKNMIRKDAHVEGIFYIAPTFNELILKQKKVGVAPLALESYMPLKTARQIQHYERQRGGGSPCT